MSVSLNKCHGGVTVGVTTTRHKCHVGTTPALSFIYLSCPYIESYPWNRLYRWLWRACCGVDGLRSENGRSAVQHRRRPVHCPDDARRPVWFVRSRARAARAVPTGWSQRRCVHSDCVWLAAVRQTRPFWWWFEAGGLTPSRGGSSAVAWRLLKSTVRTVSTVATSPLVGCRRYCAALGVITPPTSAAVVGQSALAMSRTTSSTTPGRATTATRRSHKQRHSRSSNKQRQRPSRGDRAAHTTNRASVCSRREWSRASEIRTRKSVLAKLLVSFRFSRRVGWSPVPRGCVANGYQGTLRLRCHQHLGKKLNDRKQKTY